VNISRRSFLSTSAALAGGTFVVGFTLHAIGQDTPGVVTSKDNPFNAWIHVKSDNSTELVLAQSEMGQGVFTSLPMLLAEEADLDWERVTVVQSEFSLGTGGSGSVRSNYLPLRRAGAQVRLTMISAAAREWKVPEQECTTAKSEVIHAASGRKLTYGQLVPQELIACEKRAPPRLEGGKLGRGPFGAPANGGQHPLPEARLLRDQGEVAGPDVGLDQALPDLALKALELLNQERGCRRGHGG